jgi:phosphohistidine phosphatase
MRLLLVRHAIATPRGTDGIADDERGLTPRGRARFQAAARGLTTLLARPGVLLSSPLRRARQTAGILARAWEPLVVTLEPVLADGSAEQVDEVLHTHRARTLVALVGHEPHLSELLAHALGTATPAALEFRKGGAALLDVPGRLEGGARLVWFLTPKVLRRIATGSR